jgi:hypothetical protein
MTMTKTKTAVAVAAVATVMVHPRVPSHLNLHLSVLEPSKVFQIEEFLTPTECNSLVELAESSGFKKSPVSGGGHGRTGREDARTNSYTVIEDQKLADALWQRVKTVVPETLSFISSSPYFTERGGQEWTPVGVVDRLRFYRYEKGESYPEHMDGTYRRIAHRVSDSNEGVFLQQQSFLTLLVYLNDGFEGGDTHFYPEKQHCRFLRDSEVKTPTVIVHPKKGAALVNVHNTLHQGCEVEKGAKYVLRTDILYQRTMTITPEMGRNVTKSEADNSTVVTTTEWEKIFEPSCKAYHD